jgi:hypothetical protein
MAAGTCPVVPVRRASSAIFRVSSAQAARTLVATVAVWFGNCFSHNHSSAKTVAWNVPGYAPQDGSNGAWCE